MTEKGYELISSTPTNKNERKSNKRNNTAMASASLDETKDGEGGNGDVYKYLVIDSGPIIRLTSVSTLWRKAQHFYTVPAVVHEIRDARARQHLDSLPFALVQREASREGILAVTEFARKTGDYHSLSSVDLQVLGLLYDLELEGCGGDMSHVRNTPKRMIGLGKIESLSGGNASTDNGAATTDAASLSNTALVLDEKDVIVEMDGQDVDEADDNDYEDDDDEEDAYSSEPDYSHFQQEASLDGARNDDTADAALPTTTMKTAVDAPKSWASLLGASTTTTAPLQQSTTTAATTSAIGTSLPAPFLSAKHEVSDEGGQFSDAEEDVDEVVSQGIMDAATGHDDLDTANVNQEMENELQTDFPSLSASRLVPYEGEDGAVGVATVAPVPEMETPTTTTDDDIAEAERKLRSLQPISKSGKLYNSFTKYGDLMKPKPKAKVDNTVAVAEEAPEPNVTQEEKPREQQQSRIIGGTGFSGQDDDVEDDGEGWIMSTKDLSAMRAIGTFDPSRTLASLNSAKPLDVSLTQGPLLSQRAACTTTDFAMQNVILQMNLELLSIDGMKVRKLRNWVTRCGACYTVYTNSDNPGPLGKRLFCERCGSDVLQRIAASVDGKTGRLRLHLSKKYQYNLRGTKFSLPKPGSGNRFQGDLLLREDQLLMGAWSQKVKMRSGGKARDAAQSIFGRDLASNVGCNSSAVSIDDIRVGFGRRNPNAAKGRERRGKKKKSDDKACGLRRY